METPTIKVDRQFAVEAAYQIPGWCWPMELGVLYDVAAESEFHIEIGTFCGKSFFPFVCGMRPCGKAICVDPISTVDPQCKTPSRAWIRRVLGVTLDDLRRLRPDCEIAYRCEHSLKAAESLRDVKGQVDSIYLDAEHYYAEVCRDIELWLSFLKPGGVLLGHDFWPREVGVMDAVHERFCDQFTVFEHTRIWIYTVPP